MFKYQNDIFSRICQPSSSYEPKPARTKKVSFMIGLSDVSEYEGGELQLRLGVDDVSIKLNRGEILIIPSFILHRVTTVTKGVRRVITGWGSGPNFV